MERGPPTRAQIRDFAVFVALFFGALVVLLALRDRFGDGEKTFVEMSWVVVAFVPFIIWLVATDRLAQFGFGGFSATLRRVSAQPIAEGFGKSTIDASAIREVSESAEGTLDAAVRAEPKILVLRSGMK